MLNSSLNTLRSNFLRMKTQWKLVLALGIACTFVNMAVLQSLAVSRSEAFVATSSASPEETTVTCSPQNAVGVAGNTVAVDIFIADVVNLYGADVRLGFDTDLAQVVDTEPASPHTTEIEVLDSFLSPDFVVRKIADNVVGTIWYAVTQVNPSPPVSGSGSLARVTFQSLQAGSFDLPVTFFQLADPDGFEIVATAANCTVTFVEPETELSVYIPAIFSSP